MNNFLKHRALGVISLLLTSYARIQQITGGLAGSSRHSGNNPMTSYTWRGHARRGIHRRKVNQCRPASVLLMVCILCTGTANALICPPPEEPLNLFRRVKKCTAAPVQEPPSVEAPQGRACFSEALQACPSTAQGPGVLVEGYGCDKQTGQIVGPQSHRASRQDSCMCKFEYGCKLENKNLSRDYEARVAARSKERDARDAQQQADLQQCRENLRQAEERAERARAERRAEHERQRQACDREAEQAAQRQAEAARQRKERAVKDHLEAIEVALARGEVDEAAARLAEARGLDPDAPGLADAAQRLADATGQEEPESESEPQVDEAKVRQYAGEMVSIPGGTFRMGDLNGAGYDGEKPVHSVTVPAFRMGKYEVTFAQWDACVADGGCGGYTAEDEGWGRGNRPVINVSWDDIQGFIDWLNSKTGGNFRLPTEAEWEYAARAGSTTKYSWGNSIGSNRANCDGCGSRWDDDRTAPVGSFSANAWGLHDLHGNVWEWVQDCSNDSYVGAPTDGSAWTSGDCGRRVRRGGSWFYTPRLLRSAYRYWNTRSYRFFQIGFRLAQDK